MSCIGHTSTLQYSMMGFAGLLVGPLAPIPPRAMHKPLIGAGGDLERLGTLAHQIDCVAGIRSLPDLRAQNDYSCGIGLQ